MKSRINPWMIAFGITFIVALYLGFSLLNEKTKLDTLRNYNHLTESTLHALAAMTPELVNKPQVDAYTGVLFYLQKSDPPVTLTTTGTTIEMDRLRFVFTPQGALQKIEPTDTY